MSEPTIQNASMSSDRTKTLLTGAIIATLTLASPASAETATWGPGASGISPTYTVPIHIVDVLIGTLRPEHRPAWRTARDRALAEWGVPFTVTRLTETSLPYLFDDNIGTVGIDGMLVPDVILIIRNRMSVFADQGGYSPTMNGGIAILSPWAPWWKSGAASPMQSDFAHELGHALGFNHGGTGVMAGASHVSAEELTLAQTYYEGNAS